MSEKIGVFEIIKGNFDTLYDVKTQKLSKMDLTTFYLLPLSLAFLCWFYQYSFSDKLIGHLINSSALLSGLLLNLIILVFGLKDKLPKAKLGDTDYDIVTLKRRVMKELYYNVCSASVTAFALLLSCILNTMLAGSILKGISLNELILNPVISFLCAHLFVSFMMITKRTYKLLLAMQ